MKEWTEKDLKTLVEMDLYGATDKEIATKLNRSTAAISQRKYKLRKSGEWMFYTEPKPPEIVPIETQESEKDYIGLVICFAAGICAGVALMLTFN